MFRSLEGQVSFGYSSFSMTNDPARPLIVCLPGALLDASQFEPQVGRLPGIEVLGLDYWEQVRRMADKRFAVDHAALAVVDRIAQEPVGRTVALCGHSLGGMVAQAAAVELGTRLSGLVLLETSYGPATSGMARLTVPLLAASLGLTPWALLRIAIIRQHGAQNERAEAYLRRCLPSHPLSGWQQVVRAALEWEGREALSAIEVPTSILVGEHHRQTHDQARTMTTMIPKSQLQIVPGAGHMVNLDAPGVVASAFARAVAPCS